MPYSPVRIFFFQRRVLMILMHVAAPYCIDRLLEHVQRRAERVDSPPELSRVAAFIPAIRHAITIIHRCHLAFFYLRGIFYHLAKRLVGIHYVSSKLGCCRIMFFSLYHYCFSCHTIAGTKSALSKYFQITSFNVFLNYLSSLKT